MPRFLVVVAAVALLAACSGAPEPSAAPGTASPSAVTEAPEPDPPSEPPEQEPTPDPDEGAGQGPDEEGPEPEPLDPLQGLSLDVLAEGLVEPLDVTAVPGSDRLLVVERAGRIRVLDDGALLEEPFLDLTGQIGLNSIEQGLLGLALHPDHPEDPRAFVFHSLPDNDNVLVSYRLGPDGSTLDPGSRRVMLTVDKEPDKVRHNGGGLLFGPDGHLYLSVGDAARASVNGQDPSTLPGSILRLDVEGGEPYAIPPDNPFADGQGGAPEVWWFGVRNPWRFSFDEPSGLAYVADVGQETVEEVNVVPADEGGLNFGWPSFEGTERFYSDGPASPVTDPVLQARHDDTDLACSITGGHVYRGAAIPELDGHYFYADWCRGWVRSFRYDGGEVHDQQDWTDQLGTDMVAGFAVDAGGELLVVDYQAGTVSRVVPVR